MATPNQAQDPAAAALSAIEEALNLAEGHEPTTAETNPSTEPQKVTTGHQLDASGEARMHPLLAPDVDRTRGAPRLPSSDDSKIFSPSLPAIRSTEAPARDVARDLDRDPAGAAIDALFAEPTVDKRIDRPASSAAMPANDDRESVGAILRTLQAKPSGTPMLIAGAASLLWIGVCSLYLYSDRANLLGGSLLQPRSALVLLAIVGPLLFFFMTAALTRRAQEVRMTARSMLQVAVRLAEPEAIATEQMVTLSQAIRREIASMGDGIERALARAGELETLVRSEVSNIERSFGENERRVRSLIDELSSEREAIIGNAEKVRSAITGAHDNLTRDFGGMSDKLAITVGEAGDRVAQALNGKSEEIRLALIDVGAACATNVGASGDELVARLKDATANVAHSIDERTHDLEERFATVSHSLLGDLGLRADEIVHRLDETGTRVSDQILSRGDTLATRLADTGDRLHEVVATHGNALHDNLGQMGERIAALLGTVTDGGRRRASSRSISRSSADSGLGGSAAKPSYDAASASVVPVSGFVDTPDPAASIPMPGFPTPCIDASGVPACANVGAARFVDRSVSSAPVSGAGAGDAAATCGPDCVGASVTAVSISTPADGPAAATCARAPARCERRARVANSPAGGVIPSIQHSGRSMRVTRPGAVAASDAMSGWATNRLNRSRNSVSSRPSPTAQPNARGVGRAPGGLRGSDGCAARGHCGASAGCALACAPLAGWRAKRAKAARMCSTRAAATSIRRFFGARWRKASSSNASAASKRSASVVTGGARCMYLICA